eukprot:1100938_1
MSSVNKTFKVFYSLFFLLIVSSVSYFGSFHQLLSNPSSSTSMTRVHKESSGLKSFIFQTSSCKELQYALLEIIMLLEHNDLDSNHVATIFFWDHKRELNNIDAFLEHIQSFIHSSTLCDNRTVFVKHLVPNEHIALPLYYIKTIYPRIHGGKFPDRKS